MAVRVVVDSTCDLPDQVLESLKITMVPVDVVHGGRAYRDRVDITYDELYRLLEQGGEVPTTAAPPPGRFTAVYESLAAETREILSLHLTSEHSAVYDVALKARKDVKAPCRIEVVDTRWLTMGLGLLAMDAAEAALRGASLDDVVALVKRDAPTLRAFAALDTMKYVTLGGRLNKVIGVLGTTLRIKLLLTIRDGRIKPCGFARTYARAMERLVELAQGLGPLAEWSVVYSTERGQAQQVAERLAAICPPGRVPLARLGPALGVHGGPGTLVVVARPKAN